MQKSKYAQTSIEFVILLGFMLLVFLSFFIVIQTYMTDSHSTLVRQEMVEVAEIVENELLLANLVQPVYSRQIELPVQIVEQNYTVQILDNSELIVSTTDYEYLIFLPFNVTVFPPSAFIESRDMIQKNSSGIYIFS